MAKTTSTTTSHTKNTYNRDISFLDYMKPEMRDAILKRFEKQTIDEYANAIGYSEPYRSSDIYDQIYGKGAKAAYEHNLLGAKIREAQLAKSFNDSQDAMMFALNSARNDSIATGTNRAMANANALKAILGVQQQNVGAATEAAQQYQLAETQYGKDIADALAKSYLDATKAQQWLDQSATNYWSTQNANYLKEYEIDQAKYASDFAAQQATYGQAVAAALSQILESTTTSNTVTHTPDPPISLPSNMGIQNSYKHILDMLGKKPIEDTEDTGSSTTTPPSNTNTTTGFYGNAKGGPGLQWHGHTANGVNSDASKKAERDPGFWKWRF